MTIYGVGVIGSGAAGQVWDDAQKLGSAAAGSFTHINPCGKGVS